MLASDGRNMVSETTDSALTRISVRRHGGVLAEESMGGHPGRQATKAPEAAFGGETKGNPPLFYRPGARTFSQPPHRCSRDGTLVFATARLRLLIPAFTSPPLPP